VYSAILTQNGAKRINIPPYKLPLNANVYGYYEENIYFLNIIKLSEEFRFCIFWQKHLILKIMAVR
jgi:hypothetical protein